MTYPPTPKTNIFWLQGLLVSELFPLLYFNMILYCKDSKTRFDKGHNSVGFWRLFVNNSYHCLIINIKNNLFIF
jgi:hypothetical protein